eukprot:scaffold54041_cov20-Tisochrysis_lutea.AAC.3
MTVWLEIGKAWCAIPFYKQHLSCSKNCPRQRSMLTSASPGGMVANSLPYASSPLFFCALLPGMMTTISPDAEAAFPTQAAPGQAAPGKVHVSSTLADDTCLFTYHT